MFLIVYRINYGEKSMGWGVYSKGEISVGLAKVRSAEMPILLKWFSTDTKSGVPKSLFYKTGSEYLLTQ